MARYDVLPRRLLLTLPLLPAQLLAQPVLPDQVSTVSSVSEIQQFNTAMDREGKVDWLGLQAGVNVTRQVSPQLAVGFNLRYTYQDWRWTDLPAGQAVPWSEISAPLAGLTVSYQPQPGWRLAINPSVEWSVESGADLGDGLIYGAVFSATRSYSPAHLIGLGFGAYREIDDNKVFPYLVLRWKLSERWRIGNPLPAGPAGGAGLELSYRSSERWEWGLGASHRSYRFRLNRDGMAANGFGEYAATPVFLRLSHTLDRATRLDAYLVGVMNGELTVSRADGAEVYRDGYGAAPALGFLLSYRL